LKIVLLKRQRQVTAAGNLQAAFDQLEVYKITDDGKSVFDFLLEPEMLDRMRNKTNPEIAEVTRVPTYDYCGRVTGYTDVPNEVASASSQGSSIIQNTQPGTNVSTNEEQAISVADLKALANSSTDFSDFVSKLNNL
jgi:hypothetical protein